jgi:hypothetical protein
MVLNERVIEETISSSFIYLYNYRGIMKNLKFHRLHIVVVVVATWRGLEE